MGSRFVLDDLAGIVIVPAKKDEKALVKESLQFLPRPLMSEPTGLTDVLSLARAFVQARREAGAVMEGKDAGGHEHKGKGEAGGNGYG